MALTWNVSKITEREGIEYVWRNVGTDSAPEYRLQGAAECLIFATMFVGLNKITHENWQQFAERLHAWEKAVDCISTTGQPIPAETVRRHIGLETNASTLRAAQFTKKLIEVIQNRARENIARQEREARKTDDTTSKEAQK